LHGLFGDCITNIVEGIANAHIVVFLVGHDRFKLIDRSLLKNKHVLDFCGVLYETNQQAGDEHMYWPAATTTDFFMVNHVHEQIDVP
jgi:hypothetical protein